MKKWNVTDFNQFKKNYSSYDFEEKVRINKKIGKMFPEQSNWHLENLIKVLNLIEKKNIHICEIGSWDGKLAIEVLKRNNKVCQWDGYDLPGCIEAQRHSHEKLNFFTLDDYFWNLKSINCDLFVASHTIEHFSIDEFEKLILFLSNNHIEYIYSDTPISKNWKDTWNTHVLEIDKVDFENMFLDHGYVKIDETGPHNKKNYRQLYKLNKQGK